MGYERIVLTSYMVGFCNFNMYADDDEVYNLTERTTEAQPKEDVTEQRWVHAS